MDGYAFPMCFGIILIIIEIAMQTCPGDTAQMTFRLIDREHWDCKEYFGHCFSQSPYTYSAVFQLDITRIPQQAQAAAAITDFIARQPERKNGSIPRSIPVI